MRCLRFQIGKRIEMKGKINCRFKELTYTRDGDMLLSFVIAGRDKKLAESLLDEAEAKQLTLSLSEYRSKRSIEQNKLMWALLTKLTEAVTGVSAEAEVWETYATMLSYAGAKYIDLLAVPEAEEELRKNFRAIKDMGERQLKGKTLKAFRCYEGSSGFNTKEMTDFINVILEKLSELGIYDEETEYWRKEYACDVQSRG